MKNKVVFNKELFESKMKEKGYKKIEVSQILDLNQSSIYLWLGHKGLPTKDKLPRIAKLLGINNPDDLLIEEPEMEEEQEGNDNKENKKIQMQSAGEVEAPIGFQKLKSKKLDDIFPIINDNILSIAELVISMSKEITQLNKRIGELEMGKSDKKSSMIEEMIEADKPVAKSPTSNIKDIIEGYNEDDELPVWKGKVIDLVTYYSKNTDSTFKQVLHKVYKDMTTNYGVCWEQEKVDYENKHHKKPTTLDLAYDNRMYRSILYSLLADLVANNLNLTA